MSFEKYPLNIVILSNLLSVLIYATGIFILQHISWWLAGLYVVYILLFEIRLLKYHCPNCYYYGKICAFGKGKISSIFFKKGDPEKFTCKTIGIRDLVPDILVFAIPTIAGLVLIILDFEWPILIALILLVLLNFSGNAYVRGQLACNNCKQKDIGCPALEFFNSSK